MTTTIDTTQNKDIAQDKKALIIVDVQNDFVEGGSLAVEGGLALAHDITILLKEAQRDGRYDHIITTQDWHIDPGSHFSNTPDFNHSWPVHCVAKSEGAAIVNELAEELDRHDVIAVHKGMFEASYSGFDGVDANGVSLAQRLHELGVGTVEVVGIAADYCVHETLLSAANEGLEAVALKDYTVAIHPENMEENYNTVYPLTGIKVR